jgi:hypothetical protein
MTNVLSARLFPKTFLTDPLIHIHQKKKIAVGIAGKIACVDEPYYM